MQCMFVLLVGKLKQQALSKADIKKVKGKLAMSPFVVFFFLGHY